MPKVGRLDLAQASPYLAHLRGERDPTMDTTTMTRAEKEALLLGPPRFVIRVIDESTRKVTNRVKAQALPKVLRGTRMGDLCLFTCQQTGNLWATSLGLVRDIQEQRQNHYGDWVLQQTHDPQELG